MVIILIGYFLAVIVGFTMGLLGGGGAILAVPIFVYIFQINPALATAYSLFVVGIAAFNGVISYIRQGLVDYLIALIFFIPSFIVVFITRQWIVPAIPAVIFPETVFSITKEVFLMLFFALVMLFASLSMIFSKINKIERDTDTEEVSKIKYFALVMQSGIVGLVIGLVGAGGGFLIVPALTLLAKLSIKKAIGTSLLIITVNALIGFLADLSHQNIDWYFLLIFAALAVTGIWIGTKVNQFIPAQKLKKGFGFFILTMGIFVIIKELFF